VIAGPAASGRTTALRQIARRLRRADSGLVLVGIAPTDARECFAGVGFDALGTTAELEAVLTSARTDQRRWVVLVDDAEQVRDDGGLLEELASGGRPRLTIVAAIRSTAVRNLFGHWTRHLRASGIGVVLDPDNAVDGDVLGVRLPRHERLVSTPGRGYLVAAGESRPVQLAH
jgi:S-DNA-T family DNA segregation ATPase FtsK/SpoIIIE